MEPTEAAETTRYPADDHSLSAPELDSAVIAPQVAVDHGPEVYYDDKSPEATKGSKEQTVDRSVPRIEPKSFWRRKGIVIIALLSILIAVVIVVGSVVGTTKAKKSSNTSSSSDPLVSTLVSTISSSSPQPTAVPKSGGILNDSSFAAVTLQNNDRRLFFQGQDGVVKQAIYSDATDHWNTAFSNNVTFDARNHTPFAVLSVLPAKDPIGSGDAFMNKSETIYLFYISMNNTLAITQFLDGYWQSRKYYMNMNVLVATDSRYLSMTKIVSQSSFEVCLFFEDSNGKVSALRGLEAFVSMLDPMKFNATAPPSGPYNAEWAWEDKTKMLRAALPNDSLSAPFSSSVSPDGGVLAMFSNSKDDDTTDLNAFMTNYVNGTFNSVSGSAFDAMQAYVIPVDEFDRSTEPFDILQMSLAQESTLLFWINGTKLEIRQVDSSLDKVDYNVDSAPYPGSAPKTGFPYSRLGGTISFNATAYHLYHQLDDVTIAEDTWSSETGLWDYSNITVETS